MVQTPPKPETETLLIELPKTLALREYIDNGVKLGGLIDPQHRQVEIYRPGLAVEVSENPVELSGEEVLPDFALSWRRVWG